MRRLQRLGGMIFILLFLLGAAAPEQALKDLEKPTAFPNYTRLKGSEDGEVLASLDETQLILYRAENAQFEVTIFSDLLCPYCRTLHKEIDQLLKEGISVRYGLFPLSSQSYPYLISIWCSDNPRAHFDLGMLHFKSAGLRCDEGVKIVQQNRQWAASLNIYGTPAIFLEDGRRLSGYTTFSEIVAILKGEIAPKDYYDYGGLDSAHDDGVEERESEAVTK